MPAQHTGRIRQVILFLLLFCGTPVFPSVLIANDLSFSSQQNTRRILILAGPITGHGKHTHEYEKSAILIKHLIDRSDLRNLQVDVAFDGWPEDEKLLEQADTIVMITDGGDHKETNHPLYVAGRFSQLETQMKRGCGLVHLHWSTFHPSRFHNQITEWIGGYFDYQKGTAPNKWYSAIKHYTEPVRLADHPITRGVRPFRVLEEFYYRIRFRQNDSRLKKIVLSKPTGENKEYAVGWAVERKDGGRGFGFTGGHYYSNWWNPDFRKLVLNGIVWSSGMAVPKKGIVTGLPEPTRVLIVTGHNHPAHDWRKTTAALVQTIELDPRIFVDVEEDPEFLASKKLATYDALVMNYSSWERKGLSSKAKLGLINYLKAGKGLSVIHFSNGSWTNTLPNKESDWEEYRTRIVRRVWVHGQGQSGHDAFGNFRVSKTELAHPITQGLADFNTSDELYYRQQGPLPIKPLVQAKSRDTGKLEPMAWAYPYEKSRIFQTVLGHADVSILMAADLIRRGVGWTAGLENLSFDPPVERKNAYLWRSGSQWSPETSLARTGATQKAKTAPQKKAEDKTKLPQLTEGRFGKGLNARKGGVHVKHLEAFHGPKLTVDCWIKIRSANGFNIIVANETKSSLKHWELYTYNGSGVLSLYIPGIFGEIKSNANVCDDRWHYVGMTFDQEFITLYVDGKPVKRQPINFRKHASTKEGLAIGSLVEKTIGCDGVIDEVRIRHGIFPLDRVPAAPFKNGKATVGYWNFDKLIEGKEFEDQSKTGHSAIAGFQAVTPKQNIQQDTKKPEKITGHWGEDAIGFRWTEKDSVDNRWAFTEHGRFLASTIPLPGGFAEKGLAIKIGENAEATVCYDLARLNLMAGWTGGFLEFSPDRFGLIRHLRPVGQMRIHNKRDPGWNRKALYYRGMYSSGNRVVLSYDVGDTRILESPWAYRVGDTFAFSREFRMEASSFPRTLPDPKKQAQLMVPIASCFDQQSIPATFDGPANSGSKMVALSLKDEWVVAAVVGSKAAKMVIKDKAIWLSVDRFATADFKVLFWRGKKDSIGDFRKLLAGIQPNPQVTQLVKPGARIWKKEVTTRGVLAEQSGLGYAVDTIRLPFKNPYKSLFFVSGHDWLSNGDMLICTVHGEVWRASNIGKELAAVKWSRFATGLYQPLGIKVVNDKALVLCRDQIVRLHDRNSDGEIDFYECFHSDITTSTGVHDYVCCLESDAAGNLYYIHANDGVVKVSPDGKKKEVIATGFRNPNGMGVRSDGLVTAAPQEGNWTPASMVCEVVKGRHYGYRGPKAKSPEMPLGYEKPLVFFPRIVDNSSGGQVWTESKRWGAFQNQLFHLSYGKCTMHLILRDQVATAEIAVGESAEFPANPTTQGMAVPLPFVFESGICRGRINPHDGQLYLSGLKGWTTAAVRDGSLQRVRWVEQKQKTFAPTGYRVFKNGIRLDFTHPVNEGSIAPDSFEIEAWNYRYSQNYGSPEFKLTSPNQQGRDKWSVRSYRLSNEGKSLFLEIPEIQVADQVALSVQLEDIHQNTFDSTLFATIKALRKSAADTGKPFGSQFVELEKKLRPGLQTANGTTVSSLDLYGKSPANQVIRFEGLLKLEARNTSLMVQTGESTSARITIVPLSDSVTSLKGSDISVSAGSTAELKTGIPYGYCRISLVTNCQGTSAQMRWFWKSDRFGLEPIPARAFFHLPKKRTEPESEFSHLSAKNLLLEHQCARCHIDTRTIGSQVDFRISRKIPDLIDTSSRFTDGFLIRKILDPDFQKHGSHMPSLLDPSLQEHRNRAADIAAFLQSRGEPRPKVDLNPEDNRKLEKQGETLFEQLGCVGCHFLPIDQDQDHYQRLSLEHTAAKFTRVGLRRYLKNPHEHAPHRRMGNFRLKEQEIESLATFIEKHSDQNPWKTRGDLPYQPDPQQGAKWLKQAQCANCHQLAGEESRKTLTQMKNAERGCLSHQPAKFPTPNLKLTSSEKTLLSENLAKAIKQTSGRLDRHWLTTPGWEQTDRLIHDLRCNTCHSLGSQSARLPEIIYEEGVIGLNPERLPDISQVGNKLHHAWMADLFAGKTPASRPWLKTRMPSFGEHAEILAERLTQSSGFDQNAPLQPFSLDQKQAAIGSQLVGQTSGLDCRQCHGVGSQPPRGDKNTQIALGINFSLVPSRIRKEYYDRWMKDPLRIDPQTKMPRYSLQGKTKVHELLDGDSGKQFDAIWHYLNAVGKPKIDKK